MYYLLRSKTSSNIENIYNAVQLTQQWQTCKYKFYWLFMDRSEKKSFSFPSMAIFWGLKNLTSTFLDIFFSMMRQLCWRSRERVTQILKFASDQLVPLRTLPAPAPARPIPPQTTQNWENNGHLVLNESRNVAVKWERPARPKESLKLL